MGVALSSVTMADLRVARSHPGQVRLGVQQDARQQSGCHRYGRTSGNPPQEFVMRIACKRPRTEASNITA